MTDDMNAQTSSVATKRPSDGATGKKRKRSFTHALYTGEISYGFIQRRKVWYTITAVVIIISFIGLLVRGLNLGIEFKGGVQFRAPAHVATSTIDDVRKSVLSSGTPDMDATEVVSLGSDAVQVQTRALNNDETTKVQEAIAKATGTKMSSVTYSKVGSQWGEQITGKAIKALVVFLVLVMLQIWAYFRHWKMSIAALVALLHDLIVTIGIYALVGFTVSPSTVIGVLTILGYSLYDTVVVFDKVRENVQDIDKRDYTFAEGANRAVNQVLVRSINTTIVGVLPVAALLFAGAFVLGSGPLEDLGLALFVGMIVGAYSSIFIATPVFTQLREHEPAMKEHTARVLRRRERAAQKAPRVTAETVAAEGPRDVTTITGSDRHQPRRSTRAERKK
ncbi:protein translocase subunit SecF [Cutibacterium acnes]|jgi:preprotein translocase subunit SecF|uniref:protein translocase subunit SecF n=1 Tax=Cutibacterium acnes TaxID=1747 RepID=UPI0001EF23D0|nr:protein translocase subunit SecF [Cutibacterium acnes]MBR2581248.1 protein translocase subunit SecF [Cutibacterium sp.]AEW81471.1 preprotein translocase subunit SecF [Cutibacterium acnes TypeIA2 P.acn17]EFS65346.1 export membrane protein SecF [Cutibacterium acnes HL063PA2]EFT80520.1 export membrane protein SecF [Cutibacterium acnes HL030PA2]MCM8874166.1 protein translocase subunit SecF [Cutibacterium acnes]